MTDFEQANLAPTRHTQAEALGWAELDRGLVLLSLGREREALADFVRAHEHPIAPQDRNSFGAIRRARSLYLQAFVHYRLEEHEAAQRSLGMLSGLDSRYYYASLLQPRVHYARGRPAAALAASRRINGAKGEGLVFLEARVLVQLNRLPEARELLKGLSGSFAELWLGALEPEAEELEALAQGASTVVAWLARYLIGSLGEAQLLAGLGKAQPEIRSEALSDAHCLIALRAELGGDLEKAREHYTRAAAFEVARDRVCWRFAAVQAQRLGRAR